MRKIRLTVLFLYLSIQLNCVEPWSRNFEAKPRNHTTKTDIKFYYYNRESLTQKRTVKISTPYSLEKAYFSKNKDSYFYIHGFQEKPLTPLSSSQRMKSSVLTQFDVNFFIVDWSLISHAPIQLFYVVVVSQMELVGQIIGKEIVKFVDKNNLKWDRIQIVGHCLGAHVAGIAGHTAGGRIPQIVGLDPAGPFFNDLEDTEFRLSNKSAKFVQVIHTNSLMGYYEPLGHADYYPNGGIAQPMCGYHLLTFSDPNKMYDPLIEDTVGCSHSKVIDFYIESLSSVYFRATKCGNYEKYLQGSCNGESTSLMGGYIVDRNASGNYYLETNLAQPYAKD